MAYDRTAPSAPRLPLSWGSSTEGAAQGWHSRGTLARAPGNPARSARSQPLSSSVARARRSDLLHAAATVASAQDPAVLHAIGGIDTPAPGAIACASRRQVERALTCSASSLEAILGDEDIQCLADASPGLGGSHCELHDTRYTGPTTRHVPNERLCGRLRRPGVPTRISSAGNGHRARFRVRPLLRERRQFRMIAGTRDPWGPSADSSQTPRSTAGPPATSSRAALFILGERATAPDPAPNRTTPCGTPESRGGGPCTGLPQSGPCRAKSVRMLTEAFSAPRAYPKNIIMRFWEIARGSPRMLGAAVYVESKTRFCK